MADRSDINTVDQHIHALSGMAYYLDEGRPVSNPGDGMDWGELTDRQQFGLLRQCVDWSGFTRPEARQVIRNVLAGRDRGHWFDGVEPPRDYRPLPEELGKRLDDYQRWHENNPPLRDMPPEVRALLRGGDFSRTDLRGINLWNADLTGANFENADLRSAALGRAELGGANLRMADLRYAAMSFSQLNSANLEAAVLTEANLSGASLMRMKAPGADFWHATLYQARADHADFRGASLRGVSASKLSLARADLQGADLSQGFFSGTSFEGADLRGARFDGAFLSNADLTRADLRGAELASARLSGAIIQMPTATGPVEAWQARQVQQLFDGTYGRREAFLRKAGESAARAAAPDPARRAQFQRRADDKGQDR